MYDCIFMQAWRHKDKHLCSVVAVVVVVAGFIAPTIRNGRTELNEEAIRSAAGAPFNAQRSFAVGRTRSHLLTFLAALIKAASWKTYNNVVRGQLN